MVRLRNLLKVVGINLAALVVGIVAIELTLGNWFVDYVVPDTRLVDRTFDFNQTLYEPHGRVTYTRDKYGLRLTRLPISSVQLVTVGGSTTAQSFISDGATWQDRISELTNVAIANAGVDGMGSQSAPEILNTWLYRVPDLNAKYYLHYVGINDAGMVQTQAVADRPSKYSWNRRIYGRSAILQGASRLRAILSEPHLVSHSAVAAVAAQHEMVKAKADRDRIQKYVEQFYVANLRFLVELHRGKGQIPVFVTQPANPAFVGRAENGDVLVARSDLGTWAVALDHINEATRRVCLGYRDQCRLIDLAGELSFQPAEFYDLVHNTPSGARKIGDYLAARLTFIRD